MVDFKKLKKAHKSLTVQIGALALIAMGAAVAAPDTIVSFFSGMLPQDTLEAIVKKLQDASKLWAVVGAMMVARVKKSESKLEDR